jgi:hypothetical protein
VARRRAIESENISFFYERLERGASLELQVAHAAIEYTKKMVKQKPGDIRWPKHEALWRKSADDANRRAIRFKNLRIKYHSERFYVWKLLVIPPPSEMTPILTPGDYPPDLEDIQ